MDPSVAVSFWAVSMLFVITPGVDWAYAIAAGLRHRSVLPAVGGMLAGHLLATVIVAAGVGTLLSQVPLALTALTVTGAAYLIWLGTGAFTNPATIRASEVPPEEGWLRQAVSGFGVSGLNPKVFLLFLALLPQFARATAPLPVPVQMLLLGGIHIANCAIVYLSVAFAAQRLLRTRPRVGVAVSRGSGIIMIALGSGLLLEQLLAT